MDLRRIEAFRLVALHGSLRHAANHFALTIAAVSIQIKTLEQELGVELFHRLPNKLVLTDRGRLFLAESAKIVAAIRHATEVISGKEMPDSEISLAMGADLTKYFAPAIAQIIQGNVNTKLSLVTASSFRGLSLLLDGAVDLSLGFYHGVPKGLDRYKLFDTGMSLVFDPRRSYRAASCGSEETLQISHHDDESFQDAQANR
jgi:DNA-binding transcriptional LysR family regulator